MEYTLHQQRVPWNGAIQMLHVRSIFLPSSQIIQGKMCRQVRHDLLVLYHYIELRSDYHRHLHYSSDYTLWPTLRDRSIVRSYPSLRSEVPPTSSLLVRPKRLLECLLPSLQPDLMILEEVSLVRRLLSFGGNVAHLSIRHVVDDHRRQSVVGKLVQELTLDDLLGDVGDERPDFVLLPCQYPCRFTRSGP